MSQALKVARNSLFLVVAEPVRRLISLLWFLMVARYLSVEHFGIFNLAMAVAMIASVFVGFGTAAYLTREIAKNKKNASQLAGTTLLARLFTFALTYTGIYLFCLIMGYDTLVIQVIMITAVGMLFFEMENVCVAYFDGYQRMEFSALVSVIKTISILLIVLVTTNAGWDVRYLAGLFNLAHLTGFIASIYFVRRYLEPLHFKLAFKPILNILKMGWPFLTVNILWIINFRVDMVMLSKLAGQEAVGYYSSAFRLFEVLIVIPSLMGRALYPAVSELIGRGDQDGVRRLFDGSIRVFAMFSLPICAWVIFVSPAMMSLLYGGKYDPAALTLSIFGGILWMNFLSVSTGWALTAMDRMKIVVRTNALAALTNVLANLILIPRLGYNGAAIATGISQMVLVLPYIYYARRDLKVFGRQTIPIRPLVSVLAMGLTLFFLQRYTDGWHPIWIISILVPAGAVAYLATFFSIGGVGPAEKEFLGKIYKRFSRR